MNDAPKRWWLPSLVLLGVALHAASLGMGFYADDYLMRLVLEGRVQVPGMRPWSLYDFGAIGDWLELPGATGAIPWWTPPDWEIRFLRPLASLSLWLDHALFGGWAPGWHAMSLALYALLLVLAHRLYRALGLGAGAALLALGFYAATNGATLPVGWIANRNTLLGTLFTVAAVLAVARRSSAGAVVLALLLATCAVLSKESGVVAYALVALRLWQHGRAGGSGAAAAKAGAGLAVLCALVYVALLVGLGYGTHSLFYATPWREPLRYLGHLAVLFTAGLFRLVAPVSLDILTVKPAFTLPFVGLSVVLLALLARVVAPRLRAAPTGGFLAAWIALSLLPQGATVASDRLLLDAAFGSAGLLALFVAGALARGAVATRTEQLAARTLFVSAGLLSAAAAAGQTLAVTQMAHDVHRRVLATEVGPPELGHRELVVLQAVTSMVPFTLPSTWAVEQADVDLRFSILQMGRAPFSWTREDERTLVLRSLGEPYLTNVFERVYRTHPEPPPVGSRHSTPVFEVEVLELDGPGVRAVRLRFERDLDDPQLRFLVDRDGVLGPIDPPPVGATLEVPAAVPPSPMML